MKIAGDCPNGRSNSPDIVVQSPQFRPTTHKKHCNNFSSIGLALFNINSKQIKKKTPSPSNDVWTEFFKECQTSQLRYISVNDSLLNWVSLFDFKSVLTHFLLIDDAI